MGLVQTIVGFPEQAPSLPAICDKIAEISTLPVIVTHQDVPSIEGVDEARIAFQCLPNAELEISIGEHVVVLRSLIGPDLTLMSVANFALEALGGQSAEPVRPEERNEYGRPISPTELLRRDRIATRRMQQTMWLMILALPLIVTVWCLALPWGLLTFSWRIWSDLRTAQRESR